MKVIRPTFITEAMLLSSSVAEPDTVNAETAWSATEINADGDERYVGAPTGTVTFASGNPVVVTWTGHVLGVDTKLFFSTSGSLPTGLTAGQAYYLHTALTADTFTVSETRGGRQVKTSSAGSGTHTATAQVHKLFEAALGSRLTFTADAGTDTLAATAHGWAADTAVVATNSGGALPAGLTAGTTYYVKSPTTDTFQLSATAGGAAINITGTGTGTHTIGEAANFSKPPLQNTDVWVEIGATNKWAMFDQRLSSVTSNADSLEVVLQPGWFDGLALLGLEATTAAIRLEINRATVTFDAGTDKVNHTAHGFSADQAVCFTNSGGALPPELTAGTTYYVKAPGTNDYQLSATAGGAAINLTGAGTGTHTAGQVVYSATFDTVTNTGAGTSWYRYFYGRRSDTDTVSLTSVVDAATVSLPAYASGVLTVTLTRTGGIVSIGALVVGAVSTFGTTRYGAEKGITDFSTVEQDDFGNVDIVERDYSRRMRASVLVAAADAPTVDTILTAYRAAPLVFIASDDSTYSGLTVYGFPKDWSLTYDLPGYAQLDLEVKGLT